MREVLTASRKVVLPAAAAFAIAAGVSSAAQGGSGSPPAAAASSPPAMVTATLIKRVPGTLRRGRVVRSSRLGKRVFADAQHGFALADAGGAQYPAATGDGGRTWRIDGPALHLNAAQAPLAVTDVGAANRRTLFACCGGQVVDATGDGGQHWWRAFLGDAVVGVSAPGGNRLIAFAQVPTSSSGTTADTWVYVSTDGGRHWRYNNHFGAF